MIPLLLLALGLGAALTAYEFSPHARARIDDYARVIREAHEAHRAADVHLSNANTAATVAAQHEQAAQQQQQQPQPVPPQAIPIPPQVQPPQVQPPQVQPPQVQPPQVQPPQPQVPPPSPQDVANAHANAGQVATDAGVDHAVAATEANQEAARKTAEAAQKAKTEAERIAAAQSAAKVLEREKKIAAALARLGVGECGVRSYGRVTAQKKDALLAKLHGEGMVVTGDNPWDIDTHQADVKLRAVWDPKAQVLKLIVVSSAAWAPCSAIWERIEPKLREVLGS
jgi:outer membrane biosynthesis protein TonB